MSVFKFHPGVWVHDRFMDAAILIHKVQYKDEKRTRIRVSWRIRRASGELFDPCLPKQTLTILKKDYGLWTKI